MTVYRLVGDAEFEAEDIYQAFGRLAQHFDALRRGVKPTKPFFVNGSVEIRRRGRILLPPGAKLIDGPEDKK